MKSFDFNVNNNYIKLLSDKDKISDSLVNEEDLININNSFNNLHYSSIKAETTNLNKENCFYDIIYNQTKSEKIKNNKCNKDNKLNNNTSKSFIQFSNMKSFKTYNRFNNVNTIKGNYILEETLGEGAFGKVKRAVHTKTNEKVAIKILDKTTMKEEEDDYNRLIKEINILKKLRHKNISQLYEIIESKNKLYLVVELCEGKELFDYIVDNQKLSEEVACLFFNQLIDGIEYLHTQNIVHRDLKPENILLSYDKKEIKLIDFGLSTIYDNENLLSTPCGTPSYAPPEMLKGEEYHGLLSDVWSCGVILYAMLCGYLPFSESNEEINCNNIIIGNYDLPESLSIEVKDLLKNILNIDPITRYDISQIREHIWFKKANYKSYTGLIADIHNIPIDYNVFDEVYDDYINNNLIKRKFNKDSELNSNKICNYFNKETFLSRIKSNKFDNFTASYYLTIKKKAKEGYISVSDVSCELFLEYINNEQLSYKQLSYISDKYQSNNNDCNISNSNINSVDNNNIAYFNDIKDNLIRDNIHRHSTINTFYNDIEDKLKINNFNEKDELLLNSFDNCENNRFKNDFISKEFNIKLDETNKLNNDVENIISTNNYNDIDINEHESTKPYVKKNSSSFKINKSIEDCFISNTNNKDNNKSTHDIYNKSIRTSNLNNDFSFKINSTDKYSDFILTDYKDINNNNNDNTNSNIINKVVNTITSSDNNCNDSEKAMINDNKNNSISNNDNNISMLSKNKINLINKLNIKYSNINISKNTVKLKRTSKIDKYNINGINNVIYNSKRKKSKKSNNYNNINSNKLSNNIKERAIFKKNKLYANIQSRYKDKVKNYNVLSDSFLLNKKQSTNNKYIEEAMYRVESCEHILAKNNSLVSKNIKTNYNNSINKKKIDLNVNNTIKNKAYNNNYIKNKTNNKNLIKNCSMPDIKNNDISNLNDKYRYSYKVDVVKHKQNNINLKKIINNKLNKNKYNEKELENMINSQSLIYLNTEKLCFKLDSVNTSLNVSSNNIIDNKKLIKNAKINIENSTNSKRHNYKTKINNYYFNLNYNRHTVDTSLLNLEDKKISIFNNSNSNNNNNYNNSGINIDIINNNKLSINKNKNNVKLINIKKSNISQHNTSYHKVLNNNTSFYNKEISIHNIASKDSNNKSLSKIKFKTTLKRNSVNYNNNSTILSTNYINLSNEIIDLDCLITNFKTTNSLKDEINKHLHNESIKYVSFNNYKYKCSKLGICFNIQIFVVSNNTSDINNYNNNNNNKNNFFDDAVIFNNLEINNSVDLLHYLKFFKYSGEEKYYKHITKKLIHSLNIV